LALEQIVAVELDQIKNMKQGFGFDLPAASQKLE